MTCFCMTMNGLRLRSAPLVSIPFVTPPKIRLQPYPHTDLLLQCRVAFHYRSPPSRIFRKRAFFFKNFHRSLLTQKARADAKNRAATGFHDRADESYRYFLRRTLCAHLFFVLCSLFFVKIVDAESKVSGMNTTFFIK